MMLGNQRLKHNWLSYVSSPSKAKVTSYARVAFDYGTGWLSRLENIKKLFEFRRETREGSSNESFANPIGTHDYWILRKGCLGF